jgi:outer membrane biosynthesis protein TonB
MNSNACWRIALLCACAVSGAARAEAPKPAAPAPAQPAVVAPTPSSAAKPAAPAAGAPPAPAAPAVEAKPAVLSESKYLSLLYSEISRHTPEESAAGPGEVTASFIIGRTGRVEKVTIDKTSSPAHAEIVKKILSEVVTPPPPGGTMDIGQTFRFH